MHFKAIKINELKFNLKVVSKYFWLRCRQIATDIFGFPGKGG
jgi:hypothetical protein